MAQNVQAELEQQVALGYILHGSPMNVEVLLPQDPPYAGACDRSGPPGVYGTTNPQLAMFYAVIRGNTTGRGYVYVCPPEPFSARSPIEFYSPIAVKPILQILVDRLDFAGDKPIFEAINEILAGRI